jgi:predicted signal transduction protein with EAL and GGDEF domain
VNRLISSLRGLSDLYRLQTRDADLMRAQFRALIGQLPILYFVVACSTLALWLSVTGPGHGVVDGIFPVMLCLICLSRGVWWSRRRLTYFSDSQIRRHIRNTGLLAVVMTTAFMAWGGLLYPPADTVQRGQIAFFVALTQVACVICLMPLPSVALGLATVSTLPFLTFFLIAYPQGMVVQAINFALVSSAVVLIMFRQHRSFVALVRSRRDLRRRQSAMRQLSEENRRIALTDALSGLPNRRALLTRLDASRGKGAASQAVIFIDLDGFKDINDTHGHDVGDALIREIALVLGKVCRDRAMLVRLGAMNSPCWCRAQTPQPQPTLWRWRRSPRSPAPSCSTRMRSISGPASASPMTRAARSVPMS